MTGIRELLDEATDDLAITTPDPAERVRRALRRRRHGVLAITAVVVAVAAAIVVPFSISGHNGRSVTPASPTPSENAHYHAVERWQPDDGEVASGFGAVWAMQCCGGSTAPSWVDKLDPRTGRPLAHIKVPGPTTKIAAGLGRVWTLGATETRGSSISVINPVTLRVTTMSLPSEKAEPDDIAFAAGSAWVTFDLLDQVWRLTPTSAGLQKSVLDVSGTPASIATTGNGQLWVEREDHSRLTRIVASATSARLGETVQWSGNVFSSYAGNALIASNGAHLLTVLIPQNLAGCSACAQLYDLIVKGKQIEDATWTRRGLFVSMVPQPGSVGRSYFWSVGDFQSNREAPTAEIPYGGPLAADGDGVVVGTQIGIMHWVPAT